MSRLDASPDPGKVRRMFDGIAASYDLLNDLMTAGLHHRWRELGVLLAQVGAGDSALDVCCGTGDFAFALKRAVGPGGRVVAWTYRMRCSTWPETSAATTNSMWSSCTPMCWICPLPDGMFDACTVGFGIRNVSDIVQGFRGDAQGVPPGGQGGLPGDNPTTHPRLQTVLRALVRPCRPGLGPSRRS